MTHCCQWPRRFLAAATVLLIIVAPLQAADEPDETPRPAYGSKTVNRGMKMDYGPFLCYSVLKPRPATQPTMQPATKPLAKATTPKSSKSKTTVEKPGDPSYPWKPDQMLATKGISVKVGNNSTMLFDTDTCRFAAGWTGGFLDVTSCSLGKDKGEIPAYAAGTLAFTTRDGPGWAKADSFIDPRTDHRGPLPADWARFKGIYRDGDSVVFAYSVGGTNVLEMPGTVSDGSLVGYKRTIHIDRSSGPMEIAVDDGPVQESVRGLDKLSPVDEWETQVGLVGGAGARVVLGFEINSTPLTRATSSRHTVKISTVQEPMTFTLVMARQRKDSDGVAFQSLLHAAGEPQDPTIHTHGGPPRWKEPIATPGTLGSDKEAYTLDTVKIPEPNPWDAWIRPGALDFFPDGRCAVCTWSGDVWVVSGLDAKLDKVTWKRFAAGLYEPLGLKVVDNTIYVNCRDGLYRLHDLNNDGEADFYECFNNDAVCSGNYHAFEFDLQTDREGNFYYAVCGNGEPLATRDHGCILKVSKDGTKLETYATGLRAPNGMAIGPSDEVVIGDNQGHWTPSSKINFVRKGGFYGFEGDPRKLTEADKEYMHSTHPNVDPPLCWIPYKWDNSSAGQVWATSEKWGPLGGHLFHLSYGTCSIFEVMYEIVDGVAQGGVVQLPIKFESGAMRARMNPVDGQMYVCGLKGWQSAGAKHGCLERIRYTGKKLRLPNELRATEKGVYIGFSTELDSETANDADSFNVEAFCYHRTSTYGSADYKASSPNEKGRDTLTVKSAKLQPDKRTILLEIPGLQPVEQMIIKLDVKSSDGVPIRCEIGNTINKLGK